MLGVRVQIVRWVDDYQVGVVECQLTDAGKRVWSFIEKLPMVTEKTLDEFSVYPQPGIIACELIEQMGDSIRIDTRRPWSVESIEGQTLFDVLANHLIEFEFQ